MTYFYHFIELQVPTHLDKHNNILFILSQGVKPDPSKYCGPYRQIKKTKDIRPEVQMIVDKYNHDTIGMVAVDSNGDVAAGTSTNGAKYKIPG